MAMTRATHSVILVDDHELIREGLARAFERHDDFEVVGHADSVGAARCLLAERIPDVLVSDIRLPDGSGLELVREARRLSEQLGLVVLTMYAGDEHLLAAMDAGASAFVAKDASSETVVTAARQAVRSPRTFTAANLLDVVQRRRAHSRATLSSRETEVLHLLAEGVGVAGISQALFISESTAKTHVSKIYEKLGAANRAQAIMHAVRLGLIARDEWDVSDFH